jgi:hypothetical protein
MLIFLLFGNESVPQIKSNSVSDSTRTARLDYEIKHVKSPFRIDSVEVDSKKFLRFENNTDYEATFIIPNANILFEKKKSQDCLVYVTINNVQYLIFDLPAKKKSGKFKISTLTNTTETERYPYSIFCQDARFAAEGNSSPIIIIKPTK